MVLNTVKLWLLFLSTISAFILLNLLGPAYALPANKIIETTYTQDTTDETISIFLEHTPKFKYYALPDPERIVVDIYDAFLPQVHQTKQVSGKNVQAIRIGQNSKTRTRIVLDMHKRSSFTIEPINDSINNLHLLVIHVASPAPDSHEPSKEPKGTIEPKEFRELREPRESETIKKQTDIPPQNLQEPGVAAFKTQIPDILVDLEENSTQKSADSPFSLSGYIQTRGAMDTVDNSGMEHNTVFRNKTLVEGKYKKLLTISALSDFLYFGDDNFQKDYDLDVHEAYITLPGKKLTLTLGKKILRWGKTDQLSPVDTLNPEDFREFIVLDYEDRKIPVWMADLQVQFGRFSLEGVYMPKFEPAQQDYFATDWSVFSHIKQEIRDSSLPDQFKNYVNDISINETDPDDNGFNGEFAIRARTSLNGWDIGATYHYAWEDLPFYSNFPIKNFTTDGSMDGESLISNLGTAVPMDENIEISYPRVHIAGLEFETTLGDFGIRGEAAWQDQQSFLTSDLTSTQSPTLFYILGADYSGVDWYINTQLSHTRIFDHDDIFLYFKKDTVSLLGEVNRKLLSQWLEASLHYSITLNDHEYYLSPRLTYTYITNLDLTFGAHIFGGNSTSFIGRFDHNDQLFLDATYHF